MADPIRASGGGKKMSLTSPFIEQDFTYFTPAIALAPGTASNCLVHSASARAPDQSRRGQHLGRPFDHIPS